MSVIEWGVGKMTKSELQDVRIQWLFRLLFLLFLFSNMLALFLFFKIQDVAKEVSLQVRVELLETGQKIQPDSGESR